jgi:hypothetical protein
MLLEDTMTYMQVKEMLDGMKAKGDLLHYEILWDKFIPRNYDVTNVLYFVVWSGKNFNNITG